MLKSRQLMRRLTCFFGLLTVWLVPAHARAHSVETLTELALHPSDPGVMALRYEHGGDGLLYTQDEGASWRVLCASAIGPVGAGVGPIAIAGDGSTLMGQPEGLWHDEGRGCAWRKQVDLADWVSDFAPDPSQPAATYAATWTRDPALNGILRRDENGSWSEVGTKERVLITRLRAVKRGAGVRLYESIIRAARSGDAGVLLPGYLVRSSDDLGASWQEHPFGGPQGKLTLQAVDPADPDRLVVLVEISAAESRLLVSADAGATFTQYLTLTQFGGIALAPDGRVWVGDAGNDGSNAPASQGLWTASSLGEPLRKVADYPVRCLGYQPATEKLFACQNWSFGQVSPGDAAFTVQFEFTRATEFVACESVEMAAACRMQLCSGWCGSGHFAQAPLCAVYRDDPACGPATLQEAGADAAARAMPDAGSSTTASVPIDVSPARIDEAAATEDGQSSRAGPSPQRGCSAFATRASMPQLTVLVMLACALLLVFKLVGS